MFINSRGTPLKINSLEVHGLLGNEKPLRLRFNNDLNIITGRNGSGKTTALKLLWYILSGNILIALREVSFRKATLCTSLYECSIIRLSQSTCRVDWTEDGVTQTFEDVLDNDGDVIANAEDRPNELLTERGSSVFLPTFRRIEGGFTLNERGFPFARTKSDIDEFLITLSKKLTNQKHTFVASLSTNDIVTLLVRQYADLSEEYNRLQEETSQEVISKIKAFKVDGLANSQLDRAKEVLDEVRKKIESTEDLREEIMKPLEAVRALWDS